MAFFEYSELLTLSASGKEGRGQSGKILFSYPAYITNTSKQGFLLTGASMI